MVGGAQLYEQQYKALLAPRAAHLLRRLVGRCTSQRTLCRESSTKRPPHRCGDTQSLAGQFLLSAHCAGW